MNRGERRARTFSVAFRRWRQHRLFSWHPRGRMAAGKTNFQCFCDGMGIHIFDKRTPFTHNCRKRSHGRPRVDAGLCNVGERSRIYEWRNQARELNRLVGLRRGDFDSDEVALLT